MHYSVMVSLMSGTALWLKPIRKKRLIKKSIPDHGALCWRGDVGHSRTAHPDCTEGHYRFLMHVDARARAIKKRDGEMLFQIAYEA